MTLTQPKLALDKLTFNAVNGSSAIAANAASTFTVQLADTSSSVIGSMINDSIRGGSGDDNISGGSGNDTISGWFRQR
jgi:Ca2+-binding RTX toxin-like protein